MKTMDPTKKHAGRCTICGALRPLRDDGTIIAHDRVVAVRGWRRRWAPCPGTHTPAASPLLESGEVR